MAHRLMADDVIVGKSLPVCVSPLVVRLATSMKSNISSCRLIFVVLLWTYLCLESPLMEIAEMKSVCRSSLLLAGKRKSCAARRRLLSDAMSALSACEPLLVVLPHFPFDCLCLEATIFPLQM